MARLNTSRAKKVCVNIFNLDNLPLRLTYTIAGLPIDLTNYKFEFFLMLNGAEVASYAINSGVLSTAFLNKTGAGVNVLYMEPMIEDIRDNKVATGKKYSLIQLVTDPANDPYVHIVYTIHARKY